MNTRNEWNYYYSVNFLSDNSIVFQTSIKAAVLLVHDWASAPRRALRSFKSKSNQYTVKMAPLEWRWVILCVRASGKCVFSEMWQDLDGLGGAGVNSGAHQLDQFGTTGKKPFNKLSTIVCTSAVTWQKSRFSLSERTRSFPFTIVYIS